MRLVQAIALKRSVRSQNALLRFVQGAGCYSVILNAVRGLQ